MSQPRYACRRCGTWTCANCGGHRANTDSRYVHYPCHSCRGRTGDLVPTMHTARMWNTHNNGPLPTAYPYGSVPPAEEWGERFGPRKVPLLRYRGVRVPDVRLDMESFQRGVDAALDAREGDR